MLSMRIIGSILGLGLLGGAVLLAEEPTPEIFPGGTAKLVYQGQHLGATTYSQTPQGMLFGLTPIASLLEIGLQIGPNGESHILAFADRKIVVGPGASTAVAILEDPDAEEQILALSRHPHRVLGDLQVPLDFLESTFGELRNREFRWDEETLELEIEPRQLREIEAILDLRHQFGLSTVDLRFTAKPRYRIEERPGELVIRFQGDLLTLQQTSPQRNDPLVQDIVAGTDRLRIFLTEQARVGGRRWMDDGRRLIVEVISQNTAGRRVGSPTDSTMEPLRGLRTIVLDPGHGGGESGAVGPKGTQEKDLALQVARALKVKLERVLPVTNVVLTRTEDVDIPLRARTAFANRNKADLFISLHFNSSFGPRAHGAETYFLSREASDRMAAEAAAVENRTQSENGSEAPQEDPELNLKLILWDLAQSHHLKESQRFANLVQQELNEALGLRDRGVKQAPFLVLMGAEMPAVLVELGFLSNPSEEERLQSALYRSQLVDSLVEAVRLFERELDSADADAKRPERSTATGVEGRR